MGEIAITGTKLGGRVVRTDREVAAETLGIANTCKNCTIAKNDTGANNNRVAIVAARSAIGVDKGYHVVNGDNDSGVLKVVVPCKDVQRESTIVEHVSGWDSAEMTGASSCHHERGTGGSLNLWSWDGAQVNKVKIDASECGVEKKKISVP